MKWNADDMREKLYSLAAGITTSQDTTSINNLQGQDRDTGFGLWSGCMHISPIMA
jgi:hypothetical protein